MKMDKLGLVEELVQDEERDVVTKATSAMANMIIQGEH
jgi:hypothetical protein